MRKQTKIWTTKDGQRIRICDMEYSHLENAIELIHRMAIQKTNKAINAGYNMLTFLRGEAAIDSVEMELNRLEMYGIEPDEITDLYDNLVEEKMRRDEILRKTDEFIFTSH